MIKWIINYSSLVLSCFWLVTYSGGTHIQISEKKGTILPKPATHTDSAAIEQFVTAIRKATSHFRDYKKAEAAGYKPMGPDMPNMGSHWINTGLAVSRTMDFQKPSTLTYLNIDSTWQLTGVAYTQPVQMGEVPPKLPLNEMEWHFHSGSLEKEAHGIHLDRQDSDKMKTKLAMLHVWVWSENPEGLFEPDNWALSYRRFGLKPPKKPNPKVSKALFLADSGIEYFLRFTELCVEPHTIDKDDIQSVMRQTSVFIKDILTTYKGGEVINESDRSKIESEWDAMWDKVKDIVGEELWPTIATHLHSSIITFHNRQDIG